MEPTADNGGPVPHDDAPWTCPICGVTPKLGGWAMRLYGVPTCPRCRNGFARRRMLAFAIDYSLVAGVAQAAGWTLSLSQHAAFRAALDLLPLVVLGLLLAKDGWWGRSPGRLIAGLQVVDRDTRRPIGPWRSLLRNLPLLIPIAPFYMLFQIDVGPRLGDKWAKTMVIWRKHRDKAPFIAGDVCSWCGYDLTGNVSGTCPECGRNVPVAATLERRQCAKATLAERESEQ